MLNNETLERTIIHSKEGFGHYLTDAQVADAAAELLEARAENKALLALTDENGLVSMPKVAAQWNQLQAITAERDSLKAELAIATETCKQIAVKYAELTTEKNGLAEKVREGRELAVALLDSESELFKHKVNFSPRMMRMIRRLAGEVKG